MRRSLSVAVVGDDNQERSACQQALEHADFRVRTASFEQRPGRKPDVCILVCSDPDRAVQQTESYRTLWMDVPLLAIDCSPRGELMVGLLEAGADDVLTPVRVSGQMVARVRALHRRYRLTTQPKERMLLTAGDLKIDFALHRVWAAGCEIALSPTEFRILKELSLHLGRVVPHQHLLMSVWGEQRPELSDALRVYIRHLRRKVAQTGAVSIVTRPGIGYMLATA